MKRAIFDAIVEMKDGTGIHKKLLALEEDLYEEADNQSVDLDEMCMEFEDFLDANEMYEDFIEDAPRRRTFVDLDR